VKNVKNPKHDKTNDDGAKNHKHVTHVIRTKDYKKVERNRKYLCFHFIIKERKSTKFYKYSVNFCVCNV